LFIAAGAFPDLNDIATANANRGTTIGFNASLTNRNDTTPKIQDFIQYGMIPEFMGRFPITIPVKELTKAEMRKVLTEPRNNIVSQTKFYFNVDSIDLDFTDEAIDAIIDITIKEKIGARGLRATLEKVLHPYMFNLRGFKRDNVNRIIITDKTVLKNEQPKFTYHAGESDESTNTIELGSDATRRPT